MSKNNLEIALNNFKKQYPSITSADLQTFVIGWNAAMKSLKSPLKIDKTNLTAICKRKTRNSKPCKKCSNVIPIGEKYMSVIYSDTITYKLFGAFHLDCWNDC